MYFSQGIFDYIRRSAQGASVGRGSSRHGWFRGSGFRDRGGAILRSRGAISGLAARPISGSGGHFSGRDFSPVFGRRFDDAILGFLIQLIYCSQISRRNFDDGNRGQNPDRKSAPGNEKFKNRNPNRGSKL